ncbi:MAG TPA: hypothetical protein VEZ52_13470, partial [Desulfovibrio sp.]|uniref:hypothetical protein n=1 Tax=Desulfovibrio sp. TaxID=885 RepID=UPI002D34E936
ACRILHVNCGLKELKIHKALARYLLSPVMSKGIGDKFRKLRNFFFTSLVLKAAESVKQSL